MSHYQAAYNTVMQGAMSMITFDLRRRKDKQRCLRASLRVRTAWAWQRVATSTRNEVFAGGRARATRLGVTGLLRAAA